MKIPQKPLNIVIMIIPLVLLMEYQKKLITTAATFFLYILCRILTKRNACPCIIKLMKWHGMAMHDNMRVCVYLLYYCAWSPKILVLICLQLLQCVRISLLSLSIISMKQTNMKNHLLKKVKSCLTKIFFVLS